MENKWEKVSVAEIYEFNSGLSKPRSAFGSGYPFLSFKDAFYNSSVPKQLVELVNSTEQERVRASIKRGDVFLTRLHPRSQERLLMLIEKQCVCHLPIEFIWSDVLLTD